MSKFYYSLSSKISISGTCQIIVRVIIDRKNRPRLKSGIFINPVLFDPTNGEIIIPPKTKNNIKQVFEASKAQLELDKFRLKVIDAIVMGQEQGIEITGSWLESILGIERKDNSKNTKKSRNKNNEETVVPNSENVENEMETKKSKRRPSKYFSECVESYCLDKGISPTTKKHYDVLVRKVARFEEYEQLTTRPTFLFDIHEVTTEDIQSFREFIRHEGDLAKKHPKIFKKINADNDPIYKRHVFKVSNMSENGLSVPFKKLRAIFKWLKESKVIANDPFDGVTIKKCVFGDPVYLTIEERNQIADYDLSGQAISLQQQRDIFIFHCMVGCRVSDLKLLTEDNITRKGDKYILTYVPVKTRNRQRQEHPRIPLMPKAVSLIEKYKDVDPQGRLFPFISDQKYSQNIKRILSICEIKRKVIVRDPMTGRSETKELKEIAASHLARKTFAANVYHNVKDPSIVCKMTGHVEGSTAFSRYRFIDDDILEDAISSIE